MMRQKFELLAPAGSFEILKAVIAAGADAVYVGGSRFGARAYANNFTEEELLEAIDYVHLRGKKLYLTVNTLFKNKEIGQELYEYLLPYYEKGLDAVIVQDFGAISFIKKHFPDLPIHASTQMTVTGAEGVRLLKDLGVERVVLARELSISEMKEIHTQTGAELEVFVHGALCYSYSGQCLFSSMLGGRSGNRGRCAQPCRLPYAVLDEQKKEYQKESYVLSLKDLCGIDNLKQLYEAGVSSLKIEGRMKQASYAAGVVSFYRKYIDSEQQLSDADRKHIYELGNRCGFTDTYFQKQNDKSMVTFKKPSYEKSNELLHKEIENRFAGTKHQLPIHGELSAIKGQPLSFTAFYGDFCVYVSGEDVTEAKNKPLLAEDVEKRMRKTGDSPFAFETLNINMDADIFVPNGVLNRLRRDVLAELEKQILQGFKRTSYDMQKGCSEDTHLSKGLISGILKSTDIQPQKDTYIASCETKEQLHVICKSEKISYVYAEAQMYDKKSLIAGLKQDIETAHKNQKALYLKLPAIFRTRTASFYTSIAQELKDLPLDGFVVRNYESIGFVKQHFPEANMVIDHTLYTYNDFAKDGFLELNIQRDTVPLELNKNEIRFRNNTNSEIVIYGRYPLMTTAGCVHKNTFQCDKKPQTAYLKDRYQVLFPVKNHCSDCYNTIYNSVPVSLIKEQTALKKMRLSYFRLEFTIETEKETEKILNLLNEKGTSISCTAGHYKRGVE
uniref:DUF3656 domain-containing U32 family peptidase n=1 Tax=Agathobacter sp. TaxID=2021311 RepID=UPI0040562529